MERKTYLPFFSLLATVLLQYLSIAARMNESLKGSNSSLTCTEKMSSAVEVSIHVSFKETRAHSGNNVGILHVSFPEGGQLTNTGVASGTPPPEWRPGTLLAKSDQHVWQLQPQGTGYAFDHGASDLIFGDVQVEKGYFRPEFEELVFTSRKPALGGALLHTSPEQLRQSLLAEEQKESMLEFSVWDKDGYLNKRKHGHSKSGRFQYDPQLKLKDEGQGFQEVNKESEFSKVTMVRPSMLDIDNLFAAKPNLPQQCRALSDVARDPAYARGGGLAGFGQWLAGFGHGHAGVRHGHTGQAGMLPACQGIQSKQECLPDSTSLSAQAGMLPVAMRVQWLVPVLQKYRCATVSPEAVKTGHGSVFIAMGWDTASAAASAEHAGGSLDLDLSLVPLDKSKNIIESKAVWFKQKMPSALFNCDKPEKNIYAMRSYGDDQQGEGSGDDELVKLDLNCLDRYHGDVDAIAVLVNIFKPRTVKWNNIDSAYLRVITGGHERNAHGNFFIQNADAVRAYMRLSGDDLKRDPELGRSGLIVGMFFRQATGWAFGSIMRGIKGNNMQESSPYLMAVMRDLVYPANDQWDQTEEHKEAVERGDFGQAELLAKGTLPGLLRDGQLPCISSVQDQALLMMGHMNKEGLNHVVQNPKVPEPVKQTAQKLMTDTNHAQQVRKLAVIAEGLEQASTEAKRKQVAETTQDAEVAPATADESEKAAQDVDALFSGI